MRKLDNEKTRLGNGKWQPLCSIDRGSLSLELQRDSAGNRRVFPCVVIDNPPRPDGSPSYTVTNYESDYVPTEEDRAELEAIIG